MQQPYTSPSASSRPTPASNTPLATARTIGRGDDGGTLDLQVGERFALALSDGATTWEVQIGDPTILLQVVGQTATNQGVYQAIAPGWTELIATQLPPCARLTPPCNVMAAAFHLIVQVR